MNFDYEKFKDLVHYICHTANPKDLGSTKLNKILWFSDLLAYIHTGKSITGESYRKQQFGPVPHDILTAVDDLVLRGALVVRDVEVFEKQKREYTSLADPDLSRLSQAEIDLVNDVLHNICTNFTAKAISDLSHNTVWELAEFGEEIPYCAVFGACLGKIDERDVQWAKQSLLEDEERKGNATLSV